MKRSLTSLIAALVVIMLAAAPSAADDNLLSVNTGLFMPGQNYDSTYDSLGGSLGFSFIRVNEYAGFEVGLASYHLGGSAYDTTAIGLEMLVHFQKPDYDFQPFFAMGMGVMSTDYGYQGGTLSDVGVGFILKAGARYYFNVKRNDYSFEKDRYFVSVYLKYFSNSILDDRTPLNTTDLDVGGKIIGIEVGVWTD